MTSLRIFFYGGVTSYRALFGWLSPWVYIPSLVVAPLFQLLLFVYIGRSAGLASDEFYVIGNALQYASIPCLFAMTHTIAGERFQQTLGYILISPAKRLPLFLGRALPVVANGFFVAAFALFVGGAIVGIHIPASAYAPLLLVTAVSAFSCTGLGLVNAGLGLVVRETSVLSNIIFGILLIFSGANVPLADLPGWMRAVSDVLPFRHGIEAARRLAGGATLGDVGGLVAKEALVGVVYAAVGFAIIRSLEEVGRRRATLERA
ncbi:MAG TPA: ABC transporter permease [Gaiellaceae bacterium]|jgi:ABC-2 type transport system permease protein|nr:ABC transporter permease [Gaiellaceae bacterium]